VPDSRQRKTPPGGDQRAGRVMTLGHDRTRVGHGCRESFLASKTGRFSPLASELRHGTEAPRLEEVLFHGYVEYL
jgi:hypothetical protein